MKEHTIVTLSNNEKYLLTYKTEQNGKNYFISAALDENEKPLGKTVFLQEETKGEDTYLTEVTDFETIQTLLTVFIMSFNEMLMEGTI